jgi:hypothetical protein
MVQMILNGHLKMIQAFVPPSRQSLRHSLHLCVPLAFCIVATACQMAPQTDDIIRAKEAPSAPPGADPNACFGRHTTPAIVETVTEQVLVQPPQINADGSVSYPATYRTETRQEIVRERKELWFETPCSEALTPDFIGSIQRALAARGVYNGTITHRMDRGTRRAIRAYQKAQGLDSDILSLAAARKLGLIAHPRQQ